MDTSSTLAVLRWLESLDAATREATCSSVARFRLPGNEPPWRGTGVRVAAGQSYSVFAEGRIRWSRRNPSLYGGPRFHLWARVVPAGRIVNLSAHTGTFTADTEGELELGIYMGMWKNDRGDLATGVEAYERLQGHLHVTVVAWRTAGAAAFERLSDAAPLPRLIAQERARLAGYRPPPAGWRYLLETGSAEIYSRQHEQDVIRVDAHDDQGILVKEVDFELTPASRISWRWRLETQPSAVAEDQVHTHDYISIAAQVDNGRDLTWMWSAALPDETHFPCPIQAWSSRETHLVIRGGVTGIGRWCSEERNVVADVRRTMGFSPQCVVTIWLIAVSSFQHGIARAEFSDIRLHDNSRSLQVL